MTQSINLVELPIKRMPWGAITLATVFATTLGLSLYVLIGDSCTTAIVAFVVVESILVVFLIGTVKNYNHIVQVFVDNPDRWFFPEQVGDEIGVDDYVPTTELRELERNDFVESRVDPTMTAAHLARRGGIPRRQFRLKRRIKE